MAGTSEQLHQQPQKGQRASEQKQRPPLAKRRREAEVEAGEAEQPVPAPLDPPPSVPRHLVGAWKEASLAVAVPRGTVQNQRELLALMEEGVRGRGGVGWGDAGGRGVLGRGSWDAPA